MQNTTSLFFSRLSCVVLISILNGCHFKSPNLAEQKYLVEKGAFPNGVPAWVATPTGGGRLGGGGVFSGGIIPQTFTANNVDQTKGAVPSAALAGSSAGTFSTPAALKSPQGLPAEADVEHTSPLHRIAKMCPSVESEVSSTLTNIDLKQRIQSYESLTTRCPDSWDLWLWLGKDYTKDKELVKAGRCFERVLVLDASNKEAHDLLDENRKQLNNPKAAAGNAPSTNTQSSQSPAH